MGGRALQDRCTQRGATKFQQWYVPFQTSAGSKAYGHALARAGGNEVLSLARSADRNAVHVGLYLSLIHI
jgi:acetyl-CoA acetyltransferase